MLWLRQCNAHIEKSYFSNSNKQGEARMAFEETDKEFIETYYLVADELDANMGIWPLRMGRNKAKPAYCAGPKIISYYSLHVVLAGEVELTDRNVKTRLKTGDLFCLFPNRSYSYRIMSDAGQAPLEMCWIAFEGALAASLLDMIPVRADMPFARNRLTKEVQLTLRLLLKTGAERSRRAKLKRCSLMYRLFSQLADKQEGTQYNTAEPGDWILDSVEYMKTHFREPISVRHAAEHVGIHRTHFSKMFTEHMGMNPSEYLRKLRMEQALHLLHTTSSPINEIGFSLGYEDATSFARAFRQYYGFSQNEARRSGYRQP